MLEGKGLFQAMGYHINKKGSIKENKLSVTLVIDLLVVFDNNFYQDEEYLMEYISKRISSQLVYLLLEGSSKQTQRFSHLQLKLHLLSDYV